MDLFWLGGRACLSIMDRDTKYTAGMFVPSQTVTGIWESIQRCWLLRYLGPPSAIRHDAGVQFLTPKMYSLAASQGISCRPVPIEHPQGLGIGERYHSVIRRLYNRVKADHPSISDEFALDVALKALNDTMGANGLTPTLFVYGVHPKLPLPDSASTTMPQTDRLKAMKAARDEYAKVVDEKRLKAVEKAQCPSVVTDLAWGDSVVVYRKTSGRWEGPLRFVAELDHGFQIMDAHGALKLFSKPCVRRYALGLEFEKYADPSGFVDQLSPLRLDGDVAEDRVRPVSQVTDPPLQVADPPLHGSSTAPGQTATLPGAPPADTGGAEDAVSMACEIDPSMNLRATERGTTVRCEVRSDAAPPPPAVNFEENEKELAIDEEELIEELDELALLNARRRSKDLPPLKAADLRRSSRIRGVKPSNDISSFGTFVLPSNDPRISEFKEAIAAEDKGLLDRQVFRPEIVPLDQRKGLNILRSRYVHAIKNVGTPDQKHKSRLVVQAVKRADRDSPRLFKYSPTTTRSSTRILLSTAASKDWEIRTRDISQAFVSSEYDLLREVFIVPPKEANRPKEELWRLLKPLYGLPESSLLWYATYSGHLCGYVGLDCDPVDPCLFYLIPPDSLATGSEGVLTLQVDDTLFAGSREFLTKEEALAHRFPTKPCSLIGSTPVQFNGTFLSKVRKGYLSSQAAYVAAIEDVSTGSLSDRFASLRGKLAYATNQTCPLQSCRLNRLSQIPADRATPADMKRLLKLLAEAQQEPKSGLFFQKLDLDTVELRVYTDASFANNPDLSSQLGWCVFAVDATGRCNLLAWSSRKCRRVVKSTFAAELFALIQGYDSGMAMKHSLSAIVGREVQISIFIDSKGVWDAVVSLKSLTEKRLLIDIASLRQSYSTGELRSFFCIDTSANPADAFTKDVPCPAFRNIMRSGRISHSVLLSLAHGQLR